MIIKLDYNGKVIKNKPILIKREYYLNTFRWYNTLVDCSIGKMLYNKYYGLASTQESYYDITDRVSIYDSQYLKYEGSIAEFVELDTRMELEGIYNTVCSNNGIIFNAMGNNIICSTDDTVLLGDVTIGKYKKFLYDGKKIPTSYFGEVLNKRIGSTYIDTIGQFNSGSISISKNNQKYISFDGASLHMELEVTNGGYWTILFNIKLYNGKKYLCNIDHYSLSKGVRVELRNEFIKYAKENNIDPIEFDVASYDNCYYKFSTER